MTFLGDRKVPPWKFGDMWHGACMRDLLVKEEEWAGWLGGTFNPQDALSLGSGGLFCRKDHLAEGASLEQTLSDWEVSPEPLWSVDCGLASYFYIFK